jgi:DNA polymerase-3 subunit chi
MTDIAFYHLTASPADKALPLLLEKTMGAGKKAVVSSAPSELTSLSAAIWSHGHSNGGSAGGQGSWIPHGIAGKDDDDAELCPIWFRADGGEDPINADFAFYLDGLAPEGTDKYDRIFILFNGRDDDAVDEARRQWKSLQDAGHQLSYWTQDNAGSWQKTK